MIEFVRGTDIETALDAAIDQKTKPLGSLGVLETLARQVGLIQKTTRPQLVMPAILVFAGDHGIVAEQVSACSQIYLGHPGPGSRHADLGTWLGRSRAHD